MGDEDVEVSIIVPTYDEAGNVRDFLERVLHEMEAGGIRGEVVVVDDASPDGTGDIVAGMMADHPDLRLVVRRDERGASSAIARGFREARGDVLCVMDADLSHPPDVMPRLVAPLLSREAEFAIASRYAEGGGVEGWPLKRRLISRGATLLARPITSVRDPMSGFFAIRRSVIDGLELRPRSCKICLDIIARGSYDRIVEVPFVFPERRTGESKLSNRIMRDYLAHVIGLLFARNSAFRQFTKFAIVGAMGTLVNLAVLYTSVEFAGLWYIHGAALAYLVALVHNYLWNKFWTFGDRRRRTGAVLGSFAKYAVVTTVGLSVDLSVLYVLTEVMGIWYILSQVGAILCGMVWNYTGSKAWVFRRTDG